MMASAVKNLHHTNVCMGKCYVDYLTQDNCRVECSRQLMCTKIHIYKCFHETSTIFYPLIMFSLVVVFVLAVL